MARLPVVVVGAGFCKPAGGPLLGELLDEEHRGASEADPDFLRDAASAYTIRNNRGGLTRDAGPHAPFTVENLFSEVWEAAGIGGTWGFMKKWDAEEALRELQIHLASVCGNIALRRGTNLWKLYVGYLEKVASESKRVCVISFNYDPLIEQLVDDAGLSIDYGRWPDLFYADGSSARESRGDVTLLKLHGSADWGICRGCTANHGRDATVAFGTAYTRRGRRCPACSDKITERGIVPPIGAKSAETRRMSGLWREAREALEKTKDLTIIGYSLPPGDAGARELMGLGRESRRKLPRVVCGPRAPEAYAQLFGERFIDVHDYFEGFAAATVG